VAFRSLALITATAFLFPALAAETDDKPRRRVRLGGIMIGAGYSHWSGPPAFPFYPRWGYYPGLWAPGYWGLYSPWYDPFYMTWLHPGFYNGFARQLNFGEVKLKATQKDADVFLDSAYAGTSAKLRTMWLQPGAYNLELRSGDRVFKKRIYVLSGKTLELRPELAQSAAAGTEEKLK
jgi:hypothetical protein